MNWTEHKATDVYCAFYESNCGLVEQHPSGWDAWVYIPEDLRRYPHIKELKVGECFRDAASAKRAVERAYRKQFGRSTVLVKGSK